MNRPFKNYYEVLKIAPDAAVPELKQSYRTLAKQYHPDVSGGDAARFREITEAYEVLIDPENRERYDRMFNRYHGEQKTDIRDETIDRFWEAVRRQRTAWQEARTASAAQGDGSRTRQSGHTSQQGTRPQPGSDVVQELKLPFLLAVRGGAVRVKVSHLQKRLEVKVPVGIQNGSRLVLNGKGLPGQRGASSGNLILQILLEPDPYFQREGKDLLVPLTLNLPQLMLGSKLQVRLLNGDKAEIVLPPGTQPGGRIRLEGRGIPFKEGTGDLVVEINLLLPPLLTPRQRKIIENFAKETGLPY
ncbi:MAG: DnaJ domain-containing protein [Candidatus Delongbacteria bacterium]|nr:DnaJ domain-containing protein [Candidatus Delongbacteria bacterium]